MRKLSRTLTVGLGSVTTCLLAACINELPVDTREGALEVELEATPGLLMVGQVDTVELFVELDGVELTGIRVKWIAPDTSALAVRSLADSPDLELGGLVDSLDATLLGEVSYLRRGSTSFEIQIDSIGLAVVDVAEVPLEVEERWQSVSAGNGHTCAVTLANTFQNALEDPLRRGGEVFCWGLGSFGALGSGSSELSVVPVRAVSDVTFDDVRAGERYTCGRDTIGLLYCWGDNVAGQLGIGNDLDQFVPRLISLGQAFASFDVGKSDLFTCAEIEATGETLCWGQNDAGQLGCGDFAQNPELLCDPAGLDQPVTADANGDAVSVRDAAGNRLTLISLSVGGGHACGIEETTEAAYCWGRNDVGQLGQPGMPGDSSVFAVQVQGGRRFAELAAGHDFTCGIRPLRDAVFCWGDNSSGQLGDGSNNNSSLPVQVMNLPSGGLGALSAGGAHACVLTDDDEAYCWGDNSSGQLGDGTTTSSNSAVAVVQDDPDSGEFIPFGVLSAGDLHTCAITDEPFELRVRELVVLDVPPSGAIYCWGDNSSGQLGDGTTSNHTTPVRIEEPDEDF